MNTNIAKSKRTKYVPISSKTESKNVLMPGRKMCECAATKHELVNNCTNCGRIICSQEGSGRCWFCGEVVCTNAEYEKILSKSSNGQKLMKQLQNNNWPHQINSDIKIFNENINSELPLASKLAEERKQRLLEFDKTSACRTKVIDDEKDYYQTEGKIWIDPKHRDKLKKKENELREKRFAPKHSQPIKYTLDFSKGQFIEEERTNDAAYELFEEPEFDTVIQKDYETPTESKLDTDFLKFIPINKKSTAIKIKNDSKKIMRIQDNEIRGIRDEGMCLSMHQPWASLLIGGIKKHEGRSWFTNHRGRLWIASTAKAPSNELIDECKSIYMNKGVSSKEFPESYPIGCILGCVDVIDCLPEEDYMEMYPNGESGSPFVFICENPQELNLKFPVKGKHKIYKLESHVHNAAKCGISREE